MRRMGMRPRLRHGCLAFAAALLAAGFGHAQPVAKITVPGDPIVGVAATLGATTSTASTVGTVANTNNYPAAENPTNAIDDITATGKYLNFQKNGAGFIVTPSGGNLVNAFRFASANDSPERDPSTITIEGTNSPNATTTLDSTWTTLYSGLAGLVPNPGRNLFGRQVTFTNTVTFASYRVLIATVRDAPTAANSFQFSELELGTSAVPEPTSLALAGLAAAGFAGRALRKRKTAA